MSRAEYEFMTRRRALAKAPNRLRSMRFSAGHQKVKIRPGKRPCDRRVSIGRTRHPTYLQETPGPVDRNEGSSNPAQGPSRPTIQTNRLRQSSLHPPPNLHAPKATWRRRFHQCLHRGYSLLGLTGVSLIVAEVAVIIYPGNALFWHRTKVPPGDGRWAPRLVPAHLASQPRGGSARSNPHPHRRESIADVAWQSADGLTFVANPRTKPTETNYIALVRGLLSGNLGVTIDPSPRPSGLPRTRKHPWNQGRGSATIGKLNRRLVPDRYLNQGRIGPSWSAPPSRTTRSLPSSARAGWVSPAIE